MRVRFLGLAFLMIVNTIMCLLMAQRTQCDEVLFTVFAAVTSKELMVNLKLAASAAALTSPSVAPKYFQS